MDDPRVMVIVPLGPGEDVLLLSPANPGEPLLIEQLQADVLATIQGWPLHAGPKTERGCLHVGWQAVPLVAMKLRATGLLGGLGDRLEAQARLVR